MNSPRIYIVDNSASYKKIVIACLEALNFTNYKTFDDGESCFASMDPIPDIIILDYNLGDGKWNGLEFMEEYSRNNKKINYIFLSSSTKIEVAVDAVRMGAKDYILKSKSGLTRLAKQVDMVSNAIQAKKIEQQHWNII
jgi:two-component system phosphate regulon response regulator PhoB